MRFVAARQNACAWLKPGLFNQLGGPAARGEGHGMDRGRSGRTQAYSDRCGHEVVESERSARDHESGRENRRYSFAEAGSVGRTGLACGRIAAMRVATGEQSCKRQRFAFSFAGKKGMWYDPRAFLTLPKSSA